MSKLSEEHRFVTTPAMEAGIRLRAEASKARDLLRTIQAKRQQDFDEAKADLEVCARELEAIRVFLGELPTDPSSLEPI